MSLALLALLGAPADAADPAGDPHHPGDEATCAVLRAFNAVASQPLQPLSSRDCAALDRGEIVTLTQQRPDGHHRAAGLVRTSLPRRSMWLATQDHHFAGEEAIETNLHIEPHKAVWYGMLDIPRPFADRHWVIDVWDNVALAKQSGGRFWEHPWRKRDGALPKVRAKVTAGEVPGLTAEAFDKAVEVPVTEGALVFLQTEDGDVVYIYHMTSDIGGGIPDRLVAGYVRSTMADHLEVLLKRARDVIPTHYTAGHEPVLGCGGEPVPFFR